MTFGSVNTGYLDSAIASLSMEDQLRVHYYIVGAAAVEIDPETWRQIVDDAMRGREVPA